MQKNASDDPYTKNYGPSSSNSSQKVSKSNQLINGSDPQSQVLNQDRFVAVT